MGGTVVEEKDLKTRLMGTDSVASIAAEQDVMAAAFKP